MDTSPLAKARSRIWSVQTDKLRSVPFPALLIASVGLLGLSPFASGTVGSIAAVALYYYVPFLHNNWFLVLAIILVLFVGALCTDIVELKTGEHDPGVVVIDEVLGQWMALITIAYKADLIFILSAFVLFRLFDILKPYPARIFERSTGGVAVMLDDAVAGIYANVAAHLVTWFIKGMGA
jgi:phosphatidylglycerophosphatase A